MEEAQHNRNNGMTLLYQAALKGELSTLNTLNLDNLNTVSFSPFCETTPLHIASLLGHLKFCQFLLCKKPCLAGELDSKGRNPLHLASAEGHTDVVKALMMTSSEICLNVDNDQKLPLHLAASRGHIGTIDELTRTMPCSVLIKMMKTRDDSGSVLHLCVKNNHLEALKFFVESVRGAKQLLPFIDKDRNTVLHIAVKLREIKTIKYLLSLPEMRTATNALNKEGHTALDVLDLCPKDSISLTIDHILTEAGLLRIAGIAIPEQSEHSQESASSSEAEPHHQHTRWKKLENFWAKYLQYQGNWIEETRGTLMVVATVIATMTFQSSLSPPGGVWQENTETGGYNCTSYGKCEAGTAVAGYVWSQDFVKFIFFNTISFYASLCAVLIVISGFPLKNKVIMWVLTIDMTIAVTFMLLTYMWALGLVAPNHIYYRVYKLGYVLVGAWGVILLATGLIQTARLVFYIKRRK